jgi:hypothetical protein
MFIKNPNLIIVRCVLALVIVFVVSAGLDNKGIFPFVRAASVSYIRVATTGSNTTTCGSSASPCRSISYAANYRVKSGDVITVAAGTYVKTPPGDNNLCSFFTLPAVVCFRDIYLTILGGFTTNNWNAPDPVQNLTVIDGQNTMRGVGILSSNLHMEGFTIENGYVKGNISVDEFGGGLRAQKSTVTLRNVIFKNNRVVGGGNLNHPVGMAGSGGGLAILSPSSGNTSSLTDVVFDSNQVSGGTGAERGGIAIGGGLYTFEAAVTGDNVFFINNQAIAGNSPGSGSANNNRADALGGGAGFQESNQISLSNIVATGNTCIGGNAGSGSDATGGGGFGGAFHAEKSSLTIVDGLIKGNSVSGGQGATGGVAFGGGFMTDQTNATFERLIVAGNTAISGESSASPVGNAGSPSGGGGYITSFENQRYTIGIIHSVISDNSIQLGNPGINHGGGGAGLVIQAVTANIVHSTFARNFFVGGLRFGQAMVLNGASGNGPQAIANISYTIISDHVAPSNTSALTVAQGSTADLNYVLFYGNSNNTNSNGQPQPPGTINQTNTLTPSIPVGYVSPGTPNYNYHIISTSPAIDHAVGSPLLADMDGQVRPYGTLSDIGADEYWPFNLVVEPGDSTLNLDWSVGANVLAGGIGHYEVLVNCGASAHDPDQVQCGHLVNVDSATSFTLTGLTNYAQYTLTINAYNGSGIPIASSRTVTASPAIMKKLYLPLVMK